MDLYPAVTSMVRLTATTSSCLMKRSEARGSGEALSREREDFAVLHSGPESIFAQPENRVAEVKSRTPPDVRLHRAGTLVVSLASLRGRTHQWVPSEDPQRGQSSRSGSGRSHRSDSPNLLSVTAFHSLESWAGTARDAARLAYDFLS